MNPRQHAAIALTGSALTAAADKSREFTAGPAPGVVLAECPVEIDGRARHLTDLLGPWFQVFYFGEAPADFKAACDALAARVPLKLHSFSAGRSAALFAMYGATAGTVYAVRPDGHVMARWRRGTTDELRDAFDRILQQEARV
jgi:3-(3-hydroxy-phenyl)propionate hydroxylase